MTSIISHASSDYTLVDSLHFVLSHDNPLNTVIRGSGGRRLYRVSSDNLVDPEWTMISREGGGEPVATIYWSKIGLHKVSTAGGRPRKISKFLSLGRMFSDVVSFEDDEGRRLEWQGSHSGRKLQLFVEGRPNAPVAKFQKSKVDQMSGQRLKAYLRVELDGQQMLDTIVWTFIFLERGRREVARIGRRL